MTVIPSPAAMQGSASHLQRLYHHLAFLYGQEQATPMMERLWHMLLDFQSQFPHLQEAPAKERVSERDAVLITYGGMVQEPGTAPLRSLAPFLDEHVADVISTIHILPFYPYSSDDGFSVIDYQAVDPALGTWEDVERVGRRFRLMFDAVINHVSAHSQWFQGFLRGEARYQDYFITVAPGADVSRVFRPRALPLLTPFQADQGQKLVWTTFSEDQIDLNYANPDVLLEIVAILLLYVSRGAAFIRLDAIAFLWKEIGTTSLHLPQTHHIIKLLRTVLDLVAPAVSLITETNVPHEENVSYFGDGHDEAQMVYNFSLPPLTLHAFHTGQAEVLSRWASTLATPSAETTFFNFLASHDGIGLTPAKGLLSERDIEAMVGRVEALGGYVSYRNNPDGTQSPYELNVNYLDAMGDPLQADEDVALVARRFLAAQATMLALRGVPGIYFHSLFGSRNWLQGVQQTGRYRSINRETLHRQQLEEELARPDSLRRHVFQGYRQLLHARMQHAAFHPYGAQQLLHVHEAIFALLRIAPEEQDWVLCLHNVSRESQTVHIQSSSALPQSVSAIRNLLGGQMVPLRNKQLALDIAPYQVLWLVPA